jgi:hypothetical protein
MIIPEFYLLKGTYKNNFYYKPGKIIAVHRQRGNISST